MIKVLSLLLTVMVVAAPLGGARAGDADEHPGAGPSAQAQPATPDDEEDDDDAGGGMPVMGHAGHMVMMQMMMPWTPGMMGPEMGRRGMMMGRGMMGSGMMGGGCMMALRHVEGTLAFLKAELGITEAQLGPWNAFADALRAAARTTGTRKGPMMGRMMMGRGAEGGGATMTWPERLAAREKRLAAHLDTLKALEGPVGTLYSALSDEQKRKADELVCGPMGMM
jgi:hypothetical protein